MAPKALDGYLIENWNALTQGMPDRHLMYRDDLVQRYSSNKRHYHNLHHIKALLLMLDEHKDKLVDPQLLGFCIWYHDAVYNVLTKSSELESAKLARDHLWALRYPTEKINRVYELIVATQTHQLSPSVDDLDGQFFMDIDLSILAAEKDLYLEYAEQVRNEYKVFPSFMYRRGRKKALQHLLSTEHLYKTDLFRDKWEQQARANLKMELAYL